MALIQIKRGNEVNLPILNVAEFAFTTDSNKIFIGDGSVNHELALKASWVIKNSSYLLVANENVFADTSVTDFTLTLPLNPTLGDTIKIQDLAQTFDTNNIIINRNNEKINGLDANISLTTKNGFYEFVYSNTTYGWKCLNVEPVSSPSYVIAGPDFVYGNESLYGAGPESTPIYGPDFVYGTENLYLN